MTPLHKPWFDSTEIDAASRAISSGWVTQGPEVSAFEQEFASYIGTPFACAVSSCTTALQTALLAVGVKPGDVVITVSHSFIATANSIRACGAEPVFIDISSDGFNIDPQRLEYCLNKECEERRGRLYFRDIARLACGVSPLKHLLTLGSKLENLGRVAAILPVHQMGFPCSISKIVKIAQCFALPVIEDAACAVGSEFLLDDGLSWERIGAPIGDIACFSFHPRKLLSTGDGGMLTTRKEEHDRFFRLLRHHGMHLSDLVRHQSGGLARESYEISGMNFRMTDIQAAVGRAQLEKLDDHIEARRIRVKYYQNRLQRLNWALIPNFDAASHLNWQSLPLRLNQSLNKSAHSIREILFQKGIATRPGVMNAHMEPPYQEQGWVLEASELASRTTILLPLYADLEEAQIDRITSIIENAPI